MNWRRWAAPSPVLVSFCGEGGQVAGVLQLQFRNKETARKRCITGTELAALMTDAKKRARLPVRLSYLTALGRQTCLGCA